MKHFTIPMNKLNILSGKHSAHKLGVDKSTKICYSRNLLKKNELETTL